MMLYVADMLHEAKVCIVRHRPLCHYSLPGSAFAFLVVLHLPAALELRRAGVWTGSGGLHSLASLLKATLGKHAATIILQ